MSKPAYVKHDHKDKCEALDAVNRGDWNHPLFLKGDQVYANANGIQVKNKGSSQFTIARCNIPDCPFEAWINTDVIAEYIYKELLQQ